MHINFKDKILLSATLCGTFILVSTTTVKADTNQYSEHAVQTINSQNYSQINPSIVSTQVNKENSTISAYLNNPILEENYNVTLTYQDQKIGSNIVVNGNITGFRIYFNLIVEMKEKPETIAQNMYINITDKKTGEITKTHVKNSELINAISSVTKIYEVKPLTSGDQTISGTATPNAQVSIYRREYRDPYTFPEVLYCSGTADSQGNFSIKLPHQAMGKDVYLATSKGQYNERRQLPDIIVTPKDKSENLFYNPLFSNQGLGWQTYGANQEITPSGNPLIGTNFKVKNSANDTLSAYQLKNLGEKGLLISMDVNIHKINDSALSKIVIGTAAPGFPEISGINKSLTINNEDLNQWKHIEYTIPGDDQTLENVYGFYTMNILDMDVRNIKLISLD